MADSRPQPRLLDVAVEAARRAAAIQKASLGNSGPVRRKGRRDLVTAADTASEEAIVSALREAFPDHRILAEEGSGGGSDPERRWIIDPLDGTTNFAHAVPMGCISIAYEERGRIQVAVVYDPHRSELFTAERGAGAYLNGSPLRVSATSTMEDALVASAVPYEFQHLDVGLQLMSRVVHKAGGLRILGSAALEAAYVAAGRFDAYWEHCGVHPWDVATGILLVEEAGGAVTSRRGTPLRLDAQEIVASNGKLHPAMLALVGLDGHPLS